MEARGEKDQNIRFSMPFPLPETINRLFDKRLLDYKLRGKFYSNKNFPSMAVRFLSMKLISFIAAFAWN